jgi:carbamoyl-phosphate synthase large subunit
MSNGHRIFISGAAGVIGTEMLTKLGSFPEIQVLAADRKPKPPDLAPNIEYWQGDLNQITLRELTQFNPTIYIHLAATFERSTESLDFWADNFENNVKLSHHLVGLMKELPSLKRIIFASSYLIYDEEQYQFESKQEKPYRLSENAKVLPRNLVGMAKLAHEKELEFLEQFYSENFSSLSVRIFRGYGRGSRDVISRWTRSLLLNQEIVVYNPEGYFDYIYAKDSAEGLLRMALNCTATGIINLGTGKSRRVAEVVQELSEFFPDMKVRLLDSEIPIEASEADISKLFFEVNWVPEYNLKEAIKEIIDFESSKSLPVLEHLALNVLVTSSSKKAPLIRGLQKAAKNLDREIKIFAGDIDKNVVSRFVADSFWKMPKLNEESVAEIVEYCQKNKIGLIIPTRDGELEFWSRKKELFASTGIHVLVSSLETVQVCLDKIAFYDFAKRHGYGAIPATSDKRLLSEGGLHVVKERFGAGSKTVGLGLNYEKALEHSKLLENPIFQPLMVGAEISADVWIIPGYFESVVLRYRMLVVNGESQITRVFRDRVIEDMFLNFSRDLKVLGPAVLQAIVDKFGVVHIIECNPRIGGASTASNAAGSNAFTRILQHYLFGDTDQKSQTNSRIQEITQIRIPVDEYSYDSDF